MRLLTPLAAAGLAATLALPAAAEPRTYRLDPEHLVIGFLVEHIGYAKVLGTFLEADGSFVYDKESGEVSDIRVVVDAASVETFDDRRDGHVRSGDFLDAEAHPEIVFTSAGGTAEGNTGTLEGELTVRGVTKPIALEVTLNKVAEYPFGHGKETIGASVRGTVVRSEYGMTYALGGIVGDEVELLIELEAIVED